MADNSVTKVSSSGQSVTYAIGTSSGTSSGPVPWAIAADRYGNVWTANYNGQSVTKVSPSGQVTTYTGIGSTPCGIAYDGTNMWTVNSGGSPGSEWTVSTGGSVTKITPDGQMTTYRGTPPSSGSSPRGIVFDGVNMWIVNSDAGWIPNMDNSVSKVSASGEVTTYTVTGANPKGMAFDGHQNMWTADFTGASVTKVDMNPLTIPTRTNAKVWAAHTSNTIIKTPIKFQW